MNAEPVQVVLGVLVLPVLAYLVARRLLTRPRPPAPPVSPQHPTVRRRRRWSVSCVQCGPLDPPLGSASDALEVGWLHQELHAGHVVSMTIAGTRARRG